MVRLHHSPKAERSVATGATPAQERLTHLSQKAPHNCPVSVSPTSQAHPKDAYPHNKTTYEGYSGMQQNQHDTPKEHHWQPDNIIEIEPQSLLHVTETICRQCRYPFLTLRLFLHVLCGIDGNGKTCICARRLAKKLDVHYDTVTKCLKYLREIGVVRIERK